MNASPISIRITLLASFEALLAQLDAFCTTIRQETTLPIWVSRIETESADHLEMRRKAIWVYRALWYEDSQDGRETLTCPGIVGASAENLAAARSCNAAKDAFKSAVLALKALDRAETRGALADLHRRWESVAVTMRRMGAARLNLKQAYRHVPLLERRPLKIGFTWSKQGRVIQRTSVATARHLLEQRIATPQVQRELQQLATLADEEMLARVRSVCPHLRANIVFPGSEPGSEPGAVSRRLMQAPLPILVPLQPGEVLPEFVPVAPYPPASPRLRRADVRIEDEPFLPSIRVHRYRCPYRSPSATAKIA